MISLERSEKLFDDLEAAATYAEWKKRMVEVVEAFAREVRLECATKARQLYRERNGVYTEQTLGETIMGGTE